MVTRDQHDTTALFSFPGKIYCLIPPLEKRNISAYCLPYNGIVRRNFDWLLSENGLPWLYLCPSLIGRSWCPFPLGYTRFNPLDPRRSGRNLEWEILNSYQRQLLWAFVWNRPQVNATRLISWLVPIDSGNGLVPSGSKPFPDPMLTKFYYTMCHSSAVT